MVANTSELLPEPETPVNTVSRRLGSSTVTSLRLFTRAPCTRIRSWPSATCSAGDCVSVLVAMLIMSPSVYAGRLGVPAEASAQPAAIAHQLAVGQLVHLAPGLDAARGNPNQRYGVASRSCGSPSDSAGLRTATRSGRVRAVRSLYDPSSSRCETTSYRVFSIGVAFLGRRSRSSRG